jgi:hypothetical protein
MKKVFTFLTAAIVLSITCYSQQYNNPVTSVYTKSNVMLERTSAVQMIIIGNPARNMVVLQISNPIETKYELSLYSSSGRKVTTMLYDHPAGVSTKTISVSGLKQGLYFLVALSKTERRSLQLILQ